MLIRKNDGYALPFVLIVMVIICLVGISIMSASLNNLQNQKASIERMQDQYKAAGKVEKLMAEIRMNGCVSESVFRSYESYGVKLIEGEDGKYFEYAEVSNPQNVKINTLIFDFEVTTEMTKIASRVLITGDISTEIYDSNPMYNVRNIQKNAAKMDPIYEYLSYEINSTVGEGNNEG